MLQFYSFILDFQITFEKIHQALSKKPNNTFSKTFKSQNTSFMTCANCLEKAKYWKEKAKKAKQFFDAKRL